MAAKKEDESVVVAGMKPREKVSFVEAHVWLRFEARRVEPRDMSVEPEKNTSD